MPIIADNPRGRKGPSQSERYLREKQEAEKADQARKERHVASRAPEPVKRSSTPAAAVKQHSHPSPKKRKKPKKEKKQLTPEEKRKRYLKWAFWILIALTLYFSFGWLREQAILLLQMNPTVWSIYKAIEAEIASRSLLGLFYAAFFGALFFLALPVELIFIYYLNLNYYFVQILFITLAGNLLGIAVDYFFGWLIGPKVLQWFLKKETYEKFQKKIRKAGAFIVLVGNIIPFPIEPFTVFLGAVRYGFIRLMIYTAIGKLIKFGLLWLGFKYFVKYIGPHIATVNATWFLDLIRSSFGG